MPITARVQRQMLDMFLYSEETGITGIKRELTTTTRQRTRRARATTPPIVEEVRWNQLSVERIPEQYREGAVTLLNEIMEQGIGVINNDNASSLKWLVRMYPVLNSAHMDIDEFKQVIVAILEGDRDTVQACSHQVRVRRSEYRANRIQMRLEGRL